MFLWIIWFNSLKKFSNSNYVYLAWKEKLRFGSFTKVSYKSMLPDIPKICLVEHYTLGNESTDKQLQKFGNPTFIYFSANMELHPISINYNNKL